MEDEKPFQTCTSQQLPQLAPPASQQSRGSGWEPDKMSFFQRVRSNSFFGIQQAAVP